MRDGTTKSLAPSGVDLMREGRFHLYKTLTIEVLARLEGQLASEDDVVLDRSPSQVEVPVFHAEVIASIGVVFNGKGWGSRGIEYFLK